MNREDNLLENVNDFIEERLIRSYNDLKTNKGYLKLEKNCEETLKKIATRLEDMKLIEDYENQKNDMYDIQLKQAYKTGFKDSIFMIFNK